MDTNVRDTHFQGFAELFLNDLKPDITALFVALGSPLQSRDEKIEWAQRLLMLKVAQRAYDLAEYVLENQPIISRNDFPDNAEVIHEIPDLTEWPT
jgi:hypothetical protein